MKKSIQALFTISALAAGVLLNSCDSAIFDYEGDCSVHYRLPLTYKMNYLDVDALSTQVDRVTVYVYDEQGAYRRTFSATVGQLAQNGYALEFSGDELKPGRYSMLVWGEGHAEGADPTAFAIGGGDSPALTDLTATLPLKGSDGSLYSDRDITPLFHGYAAGVELPDTYGTVRLPAIDLTKDTNVITIALENVEGYPIDPGALTVSIEADDSELSWQNVPVGDRLFSYMPWSVTQLESTRPETRFGEEEGDGEDEGLTETGVTGLLTEFTTGRLMADSKPMLVVHRNWDGKDILRLDLVNLFMLVRGHFPWDGQEYLDRIDRYTMTFFIDADLNWYAAGGINILGWKVVPPQNVDF